MSNTSGAHDEAQQQCPACKGWLPAEAVFCANPHCGKALGGFRYVEEEVEARTTAIHRFADRVNELSGQPTFVTVHALWFAVWILVNSGLITAFGMFDRYPYGLLGIILSIEAILLTGLLLISNNRQNERSRQRDELDYEVTVRTYRKICALEREVADIKRRIDGQGASTP
jgi:uncharacterized membrane protein